MSNVEVRQKEMNQIEDSYNKLVNFIETKSNLHLLGKIREIDTFISGTQKDLQKAHLIKAQDLQVSLTLKPLNINAERAVRAISKFNLLPPDAPHPTGALLQPKLKEIPTAKHS